MYSLFVSHAELMLSERFRTRAKKRQRKWVMLWGGSRVSFIKVSHIFFSLHFFPPLHTSIVYTQVHRKVYAAENSTHPHALTHSRTHARTYARTHARTHMLPSPALKLVWQSRDLIEYRFWPHLQSFLGAFSKTHLKFRQH